MLELLLVFITLIGLLKLVDQYYQKEHFSNIQSILKNAPTGYYKYYTMHQPFDKSYYPLAYGAGFPIRF
tara:strand:- start:14170 stop:14376 length:207 start_codon:yes stop_codon:yes gene_type:complete